MEESVKKSLKVSDERQSSRQMAINQSLEYSRDSFDRFGDDLCELLLSYLTFKDKIVLEDVCRQWKRTIYNKQSVLRVFSVHPIDPIAHLYNHYVNDLLVPIKVKNFVSGFANNMNMRTLDAERLKTLLKKCKRIKRIEFTRVYVDSNLLGIIALNCPQLESIQLDIIGLEEEDIVAFGRKCGQKLKQIRFNNRSFISRDYLNKFCTDFGKKLLSYCENIKSFVCEDISVINDKNPDFLPKLEVIDLRLRRSDASHFVQFVNKYETRLKKMRLYTSEVEIQTLRNTLQQVSRFRNMEDLEVNFQLMMHHFHGTQAHHQSSISDKLTEMAKSCPKLTRLVLNINIFITQNDFITGNIWECFGKFLNLRKLDVSLRLTHNEESVETLKRLKNLTDLSIRCSRMGDPFFKDIDQFLPNLKSLSLNTDYDLSDNLLNSLSKLKHLTRISLGSGNKALKNITDSGVSKLIDNCLELRKLYFHSRPNITTQTVDKLIDFANKNSKYMIRFFSGFSRMGDEASFPPIDLNSYPNIPQNLLITIRNGQPNLHPHQNLPHNHNLIHHFHEALGPPNANIHVLELNLADAVFPFPPIPPMLPPMLPPHGVDLQVLIHNHPMPGIGNHVPLANNVGPNE